jgi:hypothetical protein
VQNVFQVEPPSHFSFQQLGCLSNTTFHTILISNYVHLNRVIVPTIRGYEDAGDFTVKERLKTSIRANLLYYEIVGAIGFFGVILIMIMRHDWYVLMISMYLHIARPI